jgi:sugar lactone lactonase YvrE
MPSDEDVLIDGNLVGFKDADGNATPWHLSMNAIAIDPTFKYVYFGTMNGRDIWRIPAVALADETLDDAALAGQIERYGDKAPNDGFIVDGQGRIFSGDVTRNAVTVSTPDSFEVFAQDDTLLRWPDGFAFAPDGTMYIVANQLHTHPALNMGEDGSDHRYFILTTKP